jgi:sodium pump decarboxylase gamma subunit
MSVLMLAQADLPQPDKLSAALTLMLVGMGVVFVALLLLWAVIALADRLIGVEAEREPAAEPQTAAAPGEVDAELVAVLAAAATAAIGQRVQIKNVQPIDQRDTANPPRDASQT